MENPFASPSLKDRAPESSHPTAMQSPHPLQSPSPTLNQHSNNVVVSPPPSLTGSNLGGSEVFGTPTTTESREAMAQSARKEWKQHGSGITQALEEVRRRDEERPGTMTARLLSAETRRDVTGKKYVTYILSVKMPNNSVLQLEHRYSEFAKLHDNFKNHGVTIASTFPAKNIAGRLGNWTPSLKWAPEQHEDLVQYRKVQLDVWLVSVLEKYNLGELPHSLARNVYEFLTLSDRPPCDLENVNKDKNAARWHNPVSFTLGSSIRQACRIVEEMCLPKSILSKTGLKDSDQSIPLDLLHHAKGLLFLTVVKAGLVVSGRFGTGLLIARVDEPQKWSAPCAMGTVGMGWGALAGADVTHYLVVLTRQEAVESMLSGTVQLGTELGIAVGPVGRTSQVATSPDHARWQLHPAYSYAHSSGLFMGVSLEGSVLSARNDVNAKFYGRTGLSGEQIMDLPPPKAAAPLYASLEQALMTEIPEDGFRPSQLFQDKAGSAAVSSSGSSTGSSSLAASGDLFAPP